MNSNKTVAPVSQNWWLNYFASTEEEQSSMCFELAVAIMWNRNELDREGWTMAQRARMRDLLAAINVSLTSDELKDLSLTNDIGAPLENLTLKETLNEVHNLRREVQRVKIVLDDVLVGDNMRSIASDEIKD